MIAMQADRLFDTDLIRRNRLRALSMRPAKAATFLARIACQRDCRPVVGVVERSFDNAVSLHAGDGNLAALLGNTGKGQVASPASSRIRRLLANLATAWNAELVADLESFPVAAESVGLVASPLALHLTNDLPGLLVQINRALVADGLLLAALPGAGTLSELRDALLAARRKDLTGGASPRVIPFADVRDCGALLQRTGFALPVVDTEIPYGAL